MIEPDVNFGAERHPPSPEPLASVLPRIVDYYRRHELIEWRCGLHLFHHLHEAGFSAVKVTLVDGRIISGGAPRALVEHGCRSVEELVEPCLTEMGMAGKIAQGFSDAQWEIEILVRNLGICFMSSMGALCVAALGTVREKLAWRET